MVLKPIPLIAMKTFLRYGEYAVFYFVAGVLLWVPYRLVTWGFLEYVSGIIQSGTIRLILLALVCSIIVSTILCFLALIISTLNQFHSKGRTYLIPLILLIVTIYGYKLSEFFMALKGNITPSKLYTIFCLIICSLLFVTLRTYRFLDFHDNYIDTRLWRTQKRSD